MTDYGNIKIPPLFHLQQWRYHIATNSWTSQGETVNSQTAQDLEGASTIVFILMNCFSSSQGGVGRLNMYSLLVCCFYKQKECPRGNAKKYPRRAYGTDDVMRTLGGTVCGSRNPCGTWRSHNYCNIPTTHKRKSH